jgi:hypothetical protein
MIDDAGRPEPGGDRVQILRRLRRPVPRTMIETSATMSLAHSRRSPRRAAGPAQHALEPRASSSERSPPTPRSVTAQSGRRAASARVADGDGIPDAPDPQPRGGGLVEEQDEDRRSIASWGQWQHDGSPCGEAIGVTDVKADAALSTPTDRSGAIQPMRATSAPPPQEVVQAERRSRTPNR